MPSSVAGGEDDLYQSSFVCHWNSIQNPKRFQHDVTQIAQPTWEATRADIAARRPLYALLENVTGLQHDPESGLRFSTFCQTVHPPQCHFEDLQ